MPASANFTPYSTARFLFGTKASWLDGEDQERIASYQVYEEMYWNNPDIFRLDARGSDNKPIYVPTARTIVETINRHIGRDFGFHIRPTGDPTDQQTARDAFSSLFIRESMRSKFTTQKRFGIMRGDAFWHVVGNETASDGRKISIYELDPATVFWIYDPNNFSRVTGVHIAELIHDPTLNKDVVRRQTYLKNTQTDGTLINITSEQTLRDPAHWDDDNVVPLASVKPLVALPDPIRSLPVYHVKNFRTPDSFYGSSQLRGLERIMSAVDQSISDEELTLALEGIGVYATTSGPPQDENGDEVDWILGPGRVVEHAPGTDFTRVTGVSSVDPMIAHQNQLLKFMYEGAGIPDVARGSVDVSIAESGIALAIKVMPLTSQVEEKNDLLMDPMAHMFYDLQHGWYPAYESTSFETAIIEPKFGPPFPEDHAGKVTEILAIAGVTIGGSGLTAGSPIVSAEWVRGELGKLGYEFPPDMAVDVIAEAAAFADSTDPYAARLRQETGEPATGTDV